MLSKSNHFDYDFSSRVYFEGGCLDSTWCPTPGEEQQEPVAGCKSLWRSGSWSPETVVASGRRCVPPRGSLYTRLPPSPPNTKACRSDNIQKNIQLQTSFYAERPAMLLPPTQERNVPSGGWSSQTTASNLAAHPWRNARECVKEQVKSTTTRKLHYFVFKFKVFKRWARNSLTL